MLALSASIEYADCISCRGKISRQNRFLGETMNFIWLGKTNPEDPENVDYSFFGVISMLMLYKVESLKLVK